MFFRANFPLAKIAFVLREGVTKKAAVLLDFVQNTSPPPPPNLDNFYNFFLNAKNVDLGEKDSVFHAYQDHAGLIGIICSVLKRPR